jgi:hypothetical protein
MINLAGEVGVIAPGKLADIVVWDNDPITDITVLQRPTEIFVIIKNGRIVDSDAGGFRRLSEEPAPRPYLPLGLGLPPWAQAVGSDPFTKNAEMYHWRREED